MPYTYTNHGTDTGFAFAFVEEVGKSHRILLRFDTSPKGRAPIFTAQTCYFGFDAVHTHRLKARSGSNWSDYGKYTKVVEVVDAKISRGETQKIITYWPQNKDLDTHLAWKSIPWIPADLAPTIAVRDQRFKWSYHGLLNALLELKASHAAYPDITQVAFLISDASYSLKEVEIVNALNEAAAR